MKKLFTLFLSLFFLGHYVQAQDTLKQNLSDTISFFSKVKILDKTKDSIKVTVDSLQAIKNKTSTIESKYDSILKKLDSKIQRSTSEISQLQSQKNQFSRVLNELTNQKASIESQISKLKKDSSSMTENVKLEIKKLYELKEQLTKDTSKLRKDSIELAEKTVQLASDSTNLEKGIRERQATINKQLDSLEVIAEIKMKDTAHLFEKYKDSNDKIRIKNLGILKIQKIHLTVKEGMILEIIVTTNKGVFRNRHEAISLLHLWERNDSLIYEPNTYIGRNAQRHIFLNELIEYLPVRSYSQVPYADFDITLYDNEKDRTYLLRESTSINTYFDIAAFTDIKGISGEANGLAQFVGNAKFILSAQNFRRGSVIPLNYISFCGGLSKFDQSFKGAELIKDDSASRRDLLQRSNYFLGVKLNLIKGFKSAYPTHLLDNWQINVGYNFLGGRVFDTLYKDVARTVIDTVYRNITQNQFYIEPQVTFSRNRNLVMTLGLPIYFNSVKNSASIKNSALETWICPSINLMYYAKREASGKIFFRYNHFINLRDNTQAFSQLQLGYSLNLTDVWSKNSSK